MSILDRAVAQITAQNCPRCSDHGVCPPDCKAGQRLDALESVDMREPFDRQIVIDVLAEMKDLGLIKPSTRH
jgi:hypothetical protein